MDMSNKDNTSGVDRYIATLLTGFKNCSPIHVYRIQFLKGKSVLFCKKEKKENFTHITIPLPQQSEAIIDENYWFSRGSCHIASECYPKICALSSHNVRDKHPYLWNFWLMKFL
jgi:hypothetical protein